MFNCAAGRDEHYKQKSLVCVGSARSVFATLGLPPLTACVLSRSTLLRLQVALLGNYLRRALGCVHFPDLATQDQVPRYSTKAQTRLGLRVVPFPGPSSSGHPVLGECTLPRYSASCHLPRPSCSVSWVCMGAPSQVCHVSSLES